MSMVAEPLAVPAMKSPAVTAPRMVTLPELPPTVDFAGLALLPLTQGELIETLVGRARQRSRTTVHYLNAHTFNLARDDAKYRGCLADCDLLYGDGISIVWAARLLGHAVPERLTAADYFEEFCRRCAAESLTLFLVGGAAGVAEVAARRLTAAVPGLQIVGTSHGYLTESESAEVVRRVNDSGADVLVVGMSSPSQEQWIHRYGAQAGVPVQWAVGALLDYVAGVEPRAPQWIRRCSCEWLFRMLHNPSRRWKRYILGNMRFGAWLAGAVLRGSQARRECRAAEGRLSRPEGFSR